MDISMILLMVQKAAEYSPRIIAILQGLFAKGVPTKEQWEQARLRAQEEDYDKLVPESAKLQALANAGQLP